MGLFSSKSDSSNDDSIKGGIVSTVRTGPTETTTVIVLPDGVHTYTQGGFTEEEMVD